MNIRSLLVTAVLTTAILCSGGLVGAQATDNSALIAQLQAQIANLMAQISALQGQQSTTKTTAWCHTFNRNLGFAESGTSDVSSLHTALQIQNISYVPDADTIYTEATAIGVRQFQARYGLIQTGYVGVATRTELNSLYGCGINPVQPSLIVTSPNGGEIYNMGDSVKIKWTYSPLPPKDFSVRLISGAVGGAIWDLKSCGDGSTYYQGDASNPNNYNAFSLDWQVGYNTKGNLTSGQYKIEVGDCMPEITQDSSDSYFIIAPPCLSGAGALLPGQSYCTSQPSITVTSPNGGETWAQGSTQTITWTTKNIPASNNMTVRLTDSGGLEHYLYGTTDISNTIPNSGFFSVTIPATLAVGAYKVEVKTSIVSQSYLDASDNYFKIVAPTTAVTFNAPTLVLSQTTPAQFIAAGGGASNASQATFNFTTTGGSATITELKFSLGTGPANSPQAITNICLSECAVPINGIADLTGLQIPVTAGMAGINRSFTISYAPVGIGGLPSGTVANIVLTYVGYTANGVAANITTSISAPSMTLMGSMPTVSVNSSLSPTSGLILGTNNQIGEVTISADSKGAIKISKITFNVASSGFVGTPTISGPKFGLYDNSAFPISGSSCSVSGATIVCTLGSGYSSDFTIAAGQSQVFNLVSTVNGTTNAGTASIGTSLTPSGFIWDDTASNGAVDGVGRTGYFLNNFPTNSYLTTYVGTSTVQPSITVTSPNGGETVLLGASGGANDFRATWTSSNLSGNVSVYLNLADGRTCLLGAAPVSQGYFLKTLGVNYQCTNISATVVPGQYKVLLNTDTPDTVANSLFGIHDSSDNYFTITASATNKPTVTPAQSTVASGQNDRLILSSPSASHSSIYFACPTGISTRTSPEICNTYINTTSNGDWSPAFFNSTSQNQNVAVNYTVYASSGDTTPAIASTTITVLPGSNNAQPSITVTSPNGGSIFSSQTAAIPFTWSWSNVSTSITPVMRLIDQNGVEKFGEFGTAGGLSYSSQGGSGTMPAPANLVIPTGSAQYRVQICLSVTDSSTCTNGGYFTISKTSLSNGSVTPPSAIIYPNGGETLVEGQTYTIKWTGGTGSYNLYAACPLAGDEGYIGLVNANAGTFSWKVRNFSDVVSGSSCRVDFANPDTFQAITYSNYFTITAPTTPVSVSCSASPSPVQVGSSATFTASSSGGTGTYTYSWLGACTGTSQTCSNSFSTLGTQTASVTATSGSQSSTATCSVNSFIPGGCGTAAKGYSYLDGSLLGSWCLSGNPTPSSPAFPDQGGSTTWTCPSSSGGTVTCTATRTAAPVSTPACLNGTGVLSPGQSYCSAQASGLGLSQTIQQIVSGSCGSAQGTSTATAPTTNLCSSGTSSSPVASSGSWTWTCSGSGGGIAASCVATIPAPVVAAPACGILAVNAILVPGQSITSCNGGYVLSFQKTDGNLVLYTRAGKGLWATYTNGKSPAKLAMQADGNLVIYDINGKAIWATMKFGNPTGLNVQSDGNLVIYDKTGKVIWASNTAVAAGTSLSQDNLASISDAIANILAELKVMLNK